jgi:E3 ubiquitin-protein ligase RLIM
MKTEHSSDSLSVIEPSSNATSVENHTDEANQVTAINIPDSTSVSHSSDLPAAYDTLRGDESLLQVDVVSISSNVFSSNSTYHETRRNSRQLFWDAFSRRNSSRQLDLSPTIVLSAGDGNDSEPSNDRWVLDFGDDFFDDVLGRDYGYIGSRLSRLHERRRHSRSQIWESSRGDFDDNIRGATRCPTGLHPEGSCSCESFLVRDNSSGRSSISRIVMLAETLFEVLDEIHRQPVSLSLSIPAPELVVDSFPLKDHRKKDCAVDGDDFAQCHICLAEYEEGDKIRVLPCHHEYHMSCVGKWLKVIYGVCPLCRGDVRQGDSKRSAPQQEIHSAW